jgi:hypothetical protein
VDQGGGLSAKVQYSSSANSFFIVDDISILFP